PSFSDSSTKNFRGLTPDTVSSTRSPARRRVTTVSPWTDGSTIWRARRDFLLARETNESGTRHQRARASSRSCGDVLHVDRASDLARSKQLALLRRQLVLGDGDEPVLLDQRSELVVELSELTEVVRGVLIGFLWIPARCELGGLIDPGTELVP